MKLLWTGDWHLTDKDKGLPFRGHLKLFDEFFFQKYNPKEVIFMLSGDTSDKDILHYDDVLTPFTERLLCFKQVIGIEGNHDRGKNGSILSPLNTHPSIDIYSEYARINVEGLTIDMMPFIKKDPASMQDRYGSIPGKVDFRLIHAHPKESNRGIEEVSFSTKATIASFHGHQHKSFENDNVISIGVPQTTRNGEQDWQKRYYEFDTETGILQSLPLPEFYTIKTIEYGEEIEDEHNQYNIINAPSIQLAHKLYPGITIRKNGITLLEKETEVIELYDKEKKKMKLLSFYEDWKKENKDNYRKEVLNEIDKQLVKTSSISST